MKHPHCQAVNFLLPAGFGAGCKFSPPPGRQFLRLPVAIHYVNQIQSFICSAPRTGATAPRNPQQGQKGGRLNGGIFPFFTFFLTNLRCINKFFIFA